MNKINNFNNFMFDSLLEANSTLPLIITKRLEKILSKINHPIADRIIKDSSKIDFKTEVATLIDIDVLKDGHFTYTIPNKLNGFFKDYNMDISTELEVDDYESIKRISILDNTAYKNNRVSVRIGKLINKLYKGTFKSNGEDSIEEFVNMFQLENAKKVDNIKIVEGEDILKYYLRSYSEQKDIDGTELGNSCMNTLSCNKYINFYEENIDVRLLIMESTKEKGKIISRALLWKIDEVNGEKIETNYLMDRVYSIKQYHTELMLEHAKNNGWYHKKKQDYNNYTELWNPKTKDYNQLNIKTTTTFKKSNNNTYPFLDTLKYFYVDGGYLSNTPEYKDNDETLYYLEDTNGEYVKINNGIWVEEYNDYIDNKLLIHCKLGDGYRLKDDAIYLSDVEEYATNDYFDKYGVEFEDNNGDFVNALAKNITTYYLKGYNDEIDETEYTQTKQWVEHNCTEIENKMVYLN